MLLPEVVLTVTCPFPETATKRARATGRSLLEVPYGDGDGEKLDIYLPEAVSKGNWGLVVALRSQLGALPWPTRPLFCPTAIPFLVFFHGGYWQSGR